MGGKKKKVKSEPEPDQDWEAELEEGVSEAGASAESAVPSSGKKGKGKSKKKGFADLDDEDLDALEAEILRGEKPPDKGQSDTSKVKGQPESNKPKDQSETDQAKGERSEADQGKGERSEAKSGAGGESSTKQSKKGKKKKKKGTVDDDELEAELRRIEGEPSQLPTPPLEKKTTGGSEGKTTAIASSPTGSVTKDTHKRDVGGDTGDGSGGGDACNGGVGGDARDGGVGDGAEGVEGNDEVVKDKKKKKKAKKGKEEDKKATKRPGKGVPVAMIKKLQAAREEEERLRQEEMLRQQREEEEREQRRLEKLRLEQERKERLKQKEKERRLRRKKEGKPVTKKEREAEARRQAQLAALREQGIEVPDKAPTGEKKKVKYGVRQRNKKPRSQTDGEEQVADSAEAQVTQDDESGNESNAENADTAQSVDDDEDVLEDWEDQLDNDTSERSDNEGEEPTVVEKGQVEETDSSEEEKDSEDESSSSEDSEPDDSDLSPYEKAKRRIETRRVKHAAERSEDNLRSPVVCVLGHVDTGKTKILDKIRKTHVQDGEAGGITQQIGATFVPQEAIREQTKMLREFSKVEVRLPGLLIIDTPGHESFSNLRTRGSSLCDIAILVVDLMHGLEPQTLESISILLKGKTPFVVALNKIDRLFDWQRNPNSGVRETLKRQKQNTWDQFDERVKLAVRQFAEKELNVALFWEKVDFTEYIPMVPTSAITGDGMGDLIALVVTYSQKLLSSQLMLSREVEAVVMEVKVISGLGTTVDVILRNGELKEGDTIVLTGIDGPFVTTIRALLMPQPLRELRVKNAYLTPSRVCAAQGVKITSKGDLDKTVAGTPLLVAQHQDEIDVLKEEASQTMKSALSAIKLQERGVYVQASTLGSLEALLEFLKQSKIPYSGVNIGPVHKRDVMKSSVMLEHDSQWAVILAFDVKVEREAQEMADSLGVKIFTADIIYHLFDAFLKHRQEYRDQKRREFESVAVFPCKLRVLPNCIFNTRDPIIVGVVVESGIIKPGTPLTIPSKNFTDIGVVSSLELNHKPVDSARQGTEVCVRVESTGDAPKLYGRHFDHTDLLVSKLSRESIDAVKNYFREDMHASDWQLIIELKKTFGII